MNTPPIDQITLRDFFAAAALTGLISICDHPDNAKDAYIIADQMLEERQRDPA
jgi:hypothetical protein